LAKYDEQRKNVKSGATAPQPPPGPGHRNTPSAYTRDDRAFCRLWDSSAIWYQGERFAQGVLYQRLFETMIRNWREAWGRPSFLSIYVQLPNYRKSEGWAELQDSQRRTLGLRNTGMASRSISAIQRTFIDEQSRCRTRNGEGRSRHRVGEQITYSGPCSARRRVRQRVRVWLTRQVDR